MRQPSLADLFTVAVQRHGGQTKVAKKCGITQSMVSLYMAGKVKSIKSENVIRIASCLGIKPAQLLAACRPIDSTTP